MEAGTLPREPTWWPCVCSAAGLARLALPTALLDSKTPGFPTLRGPAGRPQTEGAAGSGRRATRTVLPELDDRLVHTGERCGG